MMDELLAESVSQPRFTTLLLAGFAFLAMTLALVLVIDPMNMMLLQGVGRVSGW